MAKRNKVKPGPTLRALLERGLEAEQRGALDEAAKLYAQAVRRAPDNPDALHLAGANARRRGKLADATALLERAAAKGPDDPRHHNALGITASERGDRAGAVASFRRAVALAPELVQAHFNLAAAEEDLGRLEAAEASYRRAIALAPGLAAAHYNLGGVLLALRRPEEAAACFRAALALHPEFPKALSNLGIALREIDPQALDASAEQQERALAIDPTLVSAWVNLGLVRKEQGDKAAALACFERAQALDPEHPTAAHMVAALRQQTTARPPEGYVAQLFDGYAERFDAALTEGLGYRVPERIAALIADRFAGRRFRRALDLGCGTGLSGAALRSACAELIGVDLSPKMIDKARARGVYDALSVGDIEAYLRQEGAPFDLIVAADVLVYLGDLAPLFDAVRARLSDDGVFVFTTERAGDVDYVLRDTCRYAHGRAYLDRLAQARGLHVTLAEDAVLRQQRGEPVDGTLSLLVVGDAR